MPEDSILTDTGGADAAAAKAASDAAAAAAAAGGGAGGGAGDVTPEAAHDAAIAAVQAWQADPSKPELKEAAQKAVDVAKGKADAVKAALAAGKAPDKYTLALPKDSLLKQEHLETLSAYAKKHGFTQAQAEATLQRDHQAAADAQAAQVAMVKNQSETWAKETIADPEIGGDKLKEVAERCKRVLQKFGDKELNDDLAMSGLGNNKRLVKLLNNIGLAMKEDQLVLGGDQAGSGGDKSAVSSLLPATMAHIKAGQAAS